MGKLIFADSVANLKAKLPNWNVNTDPSYYSIAFTEDGYLLTHGKQFALTIIGDNNADAVKLALSNDKTQLLLTGNNNGGFNIGVGSKQISLDKIVYVFNFTASSLPELVVLILILVL